MFKWIRDWKIFRRRRQRRYLQETLLALLRGEEVLIPVYFLQRLRDYDETTLDPIIEKRFDRLQEITEHTYSRQCDQERAFKQADWLFLEAVKYAL